MTNLEEESTENEEVSNEKRYFFTGPVIVCAILVTRVLRLSGVQGVLISDSIN